jgi:hypothetical protein
VRKRRTTLDNKAVAGSTEKYSKEQKKLNENNFLMFNHGKTEKITTREYLKGNTTKTL